MMEITETLFDLSGKVALVTGGSRGLGKEMIRAFAQAGADVVIASRKLDACEALAREVQENYKVNTLALSCHVGDWNGLGEIVERIYNHFGKIDVLVNNAGMSPLYDHVSEVSEALYDKVLDVNLKGPFRLMSLIGPQMAASEGGTIINIGSTGAIRPRPQIIPYAAAKLGLNAMTEGFAHAFGPTVRVNCIMCGPFLTGISKAWDMDAFLERAKEMALERGGRPDEVIGAALYFASRASSFCTGAILRLDGGMP